MRPRSRRCLAIATTAAAALTTAMTGPAGAAAVPQPAPTPPTMAPLVTAPAGTGIPGSFIVVLRSGRGVAATQATATVAQDAGGVVRHRYSAALNGFAAALSDAAVERLRRDPNVEYIEADRIVRATDTQTSATWGLDRIDQRKLPLSGSYTYDQTGAGVTAYIIDTGIFGSHNELAGRTRNGFSAINDGQGTNDCNGHGTHVSGTVGGRTYGVAKSVNLVAVRVLGCSGGGATSGVIAGVDWVTGDHPSGAPAVANMSLGGGASSALDRAVANSINDGVTYAVAAGNEHADACGSSPARTASALTAGATTGTDLRAEFSNVGSCVDLFAPGVDITSAWHGDNSATRTISGTSMATPHVAGAAALYLQAHPSASPAEVADKLKAAATRGVVIDAGAGSPNLLLNSLPSAPVPPPPAPPSCAGLPEQHSGSLAAGGTAVKPTFGLYFAWKGIHTACVNGPAGSDFDLYIEQLKGLTWTVVSQGTSSSSGERVTQTSGEAGFFRVRIVAYAGSGSYTLAMKRP